MPACFFSTAKDTNMYRMQKTKHWYSETLLRNQANAPISIQKFADVKKPNDSIESGFWSYPYWSSLFLLNTPSGEQPSTAIFLLTRTNLVPCDILSFLEREMLNFLRVMTSFAS